MKYVVTDEQVANVVTSIKASSDICECGNYHIDFESVRSAIESFAHTLGEPVAVPDALNDIPTEDYGAGINMDCEQSYIDGWNACREAMLAQGYGGMRDGWKLVPVEPTHEMCGAPDAVWHP